MTFFCTIELTAGPSTSARYGRHVRRTYAPNIFIEIAESIFSASDTHTHHPRPHTIKVFTLACSSFDKERVREVPGFSKIFSFLNCSRRRAVPLLWASATVISASATRSDQSCLSLPTRHPQPELKRSTHHRTRTQRQTNEVHAPALSSAVRCAVAASAIGNECCLSSSSICTTRGSVNGEGEV